MIKNNQWGLYWAFIVGDHTRTFNVLNMIKNYFGEKTTYNIAFLLHYQAWLMIPSLFGILTFFYQIYDYADQGDFNKSLDGRMNPIYGIFLVIWASLYLESWRKFDEVINILWDSNNSFSKNEDSRVHYAYFIFNWFTGIKEKLRRVPTWKERLGT